MIYEDYTNYKKLITAIEEWHESEVKKLPIHNVMDRLPESDEIRQKAQQMDEKEFDQWWWETVYKGN